MGKDDEKVTHQIRVNGDLGEMISWIIRIEGGTTAQLLDPMLRGPILARFERYKDEVELIKAAERKLRQTEEEAKARIEQKSEDRPKKKRPE